MLSRSRRGLLALVIGGTALLLSACGTGFSAQTSQVYTAGNGTNHRVGNIEILNAVFVNNGDGTATLSSGVLSNEPDGDAINSVDATDTGGDGIAIELRSPVELPPGELVSVGTKPSIVLPNGGFQNGFMVNLTMTFDKAAPITIKVPVEQRSEMYEEVATPAPKKSASEKSASEQTPGPNEESPSADASE